MKFTDKTKKRIAEARWCAFNEWGLSYHKCRFCGRGFGDFSGLWKYAVRHYICQPCKDAAIAEYEADMGKLRTAIRRRFAEGR